VSAYSSGAELRRALLARQRGLAADGRIVMAGRDIGTVVLPDADLKLFLDASVKERAGRRALERGVAPGSPEGVEILAELKRRDDLDSNRIVAPLRAAEDAVVIRTDGNAFEMTVSLVVNQIRRAEADRGDASAPAGATAADATAPDATPGRPARPRRPPPKPTPIATRVGFLIGMGSAVLRGIARSILRIGFEGDQDLPRSGPLIVAANHASSA